MVLSYRQAMLCYTQAKTDNVADSAISNLAYFSVHDEPNVIIFMKLITKLQDIAMQRLSDVLHYHKQHVVFNE